MNILVFSGKEPKISDFGLAKALRNSTSASRSASSSRRGGTIRWMAPEQLIHQETPSDRTDVYSLGVVIWETLTGLVPYADIHGEMQVVDAIKSGHQLTIAATGPHSSAVLQGLQCMWLSQNRRPSASESISLWTVLRSQIIQLQGSQEAAELKKLTQGAEYSAIRNHIEDNFSSTSGSRILVTSIFSVSSKARADAFRKGQSKNRDNNVESLLHGTSKQALRSIFDAGFREPTKSEVTTLNQDAAAAADSDAELDSDDSDDEGPGKCGMSATVTSSRAVLRFGQGIYFTNDVSRASHYSEERDSNVLLLCDVSVGKVLTLDKDNNHIDSAWLSKQGYDSVRNKYTKKGSSFNDYVVYRPNQAIVRYMIEFRIARLQTAKMAAKIESKWQQSHASRKRERFRDASVAQHIYAVGNGTDAEQEAALDTLGNLCRDDPDGARQLDTQSGLWTACFRNINHSVCEPVIWFTCRLFHNYAFNNIAAQKVLMSNGSITTLKTCLLARNEAIVQKAAIAICNMTTDVAQDFDVDAAEGVALALLKGFESVSEDLTKIYIVCGLRNLMARDTSKGCCQQLLRMALGVAQVLENSGYLLGMWTCSCLHFLSNLCLQLDNHAMKEALYENAAMLVPCLQNVFTRGHKSWDEDCSAVLMKFVLLQDCARKRGGLFFTMHGSDTFTEKWLEVLLAACNDASSMSAANTDILWYGTQVMSIRSRVGFEDALRKQSYFKELATFAANSTEANRRTVKGAKVFLAKGLLKHPLSDGSTQKRLKEVASDDTKYGGDSMTVSNAAVTGAIGESSSGN